jgi:hypothetical protein
MRRFERGERNFRSECPRTPIIASDAWAAADAKLGGVVAA